MWAALSREAACRKRKAGGWRRVAERYRGSRRTRERSAVTLETGGPKPWWRTRRSAGAGKGGR